LDDAAEGAVYVTEDVVTLLREPTPESVQETPLPLASFATVAVIGSDWLTPSVWGVEGLSVMELTLRCDEDPPPQPAMTRLNATDPANRFLDSCLLNESNPE
jgi:hypothetical protein